MRKTKKRAKATSKNPLPWRPNKKKWTDTLFDKKLLSNPSLMTHYELARALEEHQEWRLGAGKYRWDEDPFKENAETEAPFSPGVLSNIITEAIARLKIGGTLAMGRFKDHV